MSGTVLAEISLNCGLLYGLALVNEKLYVASHDDNGGIYVVNFQDGTSEKVASIGNECSKVHSLTTYENSLMFRDTVDHSKSVQSCHTGMHSIYSKRKWNKTWKKCTVCPASRVDCRTKNSVYSRLFYGLLKDGKRRFSIG